MAQQKYSESWRLPSEMRKLIIFNTPEQIFYILEWDYLKPFLSVIEVGKERETEQAKKLIEDPSNINFQSSWPEDSLDFKKG